MNSPISTEINLDVDVEFTYGKDEDVEIAAVLIGEKPVQNILPQLPDEVIESLKDEIYDLIMDEEAAGPEEK